MNNQIWAEVVTIGSELVLGQLVDTNAAYIAACLAEIGIGMAYHTTVGDDREKMAAAMRQALDRCQIVITTGGIGPTEDDLTREVAAELMGRNLVLRPELLEYIESLFKRMGYKMAPNNRRQAYIPEGAEVIHNPRGTAPAFRYEAAGGRVLICLPGVPHETEPLIKEEILPFLQKKYNPDGRVWINRVLKVCGVGESNVDAQIKDIIQSSENPTIGLQASPMEIKIRLTARADSRQAAITLLDQVEARIRGKLGALIFGQGEETLPQNTARLVREQGVNLAMVDTMTSGLVISELGRLLDEDQLLGGLILDAAPPAELSARAFDEFGADLVLVVTGSPEKEDRIRTEILVREKDGRENERILSLGGPPRRIKERAATMALFTLWSFLNEKSGR